MSQLYTKSKYLLNSFDSKLLGEDHISLFSDRGALSNFCFNNWAQISAGIRFQAEIYPARGGERGVLWAASDEKRGKKLGSLALVSEKEARVSKQRRLVNKRFASHNRHFRPCRGGEEKLKRREVTMTHEECEMGKDIYIIVKLLYVIGFKEKF